MELVIGLPAWRDALFMTRGKDQEEIPLYSALSKRIGWRRSTIRTSTSAPTGLSGFGVAIGPTAGA
jgi:hypothetical protein